MGCQQSRPRGDVSVRRGLIAAPPFLPPGGMRFPGPPPMMPPMPSNMPPPPAAPAQPQQASPSGPEQAQGAEHAAPQAQGFNPMQQAGMGYQAPPVPMPYQMPQVGAPYAGAAMQPQGAPVQPQGAPMQPAIDPAAAQQLAMMQQQAMMQQAYQQQQHAALAAMLPYLLPQAAAMAPPSGSTAVEPTQPAGAPAPAVRPAGPIARRPTYTTKGRDGAYTTRS